MSPDWLRLKGLTAWSSAGGLAVQDWAVRISADGLAEGEDWEGLDGTGRDAELKRAGWTSVL